MKCFRLLALLLFFVGAPAFAQQPASGPNPTAQSATEDQLFKQERTIGGRITIPDERAQVLIQPQGRYWRQFHEVYLPWIAGASILLMLIVLVLFYMIAGPTRAAASTGRRIIRFGFVERFTHWMVATSFIILGLTGLNYFFGKRLIMPWLGASAFGAFSEWAKYAHNFFAWPFTLGVLAMVVLWSRDNMPRRLDWAWLKAGGGLTGRTHVHAGRFNAGQKIMFWGVVLGGLAMFLSGLMLLLPLVFVGVNAMQVTNIAHGTIGALFITAILAHIYIGTIGMEGAFDAMGDGSVDLAWARQHHDLWADEVAGSATREEPPPPAEGVRQRL